MNSEGISINIADDVDQGVWDYEIDSSIDTKEKSNLKLLSEAEKYL